VYPMNGQAEGFASGEMRDQSIAAAESDGWIFCWGPCGTSKAHPEHQAGSSAGKFDQFVVAFRAGPPTYAWSGLATLSHPFTWTEYPTTTGIMMHEIGHNFGMNHGRTTKFRDDKYPPTDAGDTDSTPVSERCLTIRMLTPDSSSSIDNRCRG
jgi:hypothetical protein